MAHLPYDLVFCGPKHSITNVIHEIKVVLKNIKRNYDIGGLYICLDFRYDWRLNSSVYMYPCLQFRPQHLFTFVSRVHTKMKLRHAEQSNQAVFCSPSSFSHRKHDDDVLCMHRNIFDINSHGYTAWNPLNFRIQRTRTDAILHFSGGL